MDYLSKVDFVNNNNVKNPKVRQKVESAIARQAIFTLDGGGTPTAIMKTNAKNALANPAAEVNRFIWYVAWDTGINTTVDSGGTVSDADVQPIVDAKRDVAWGT